MGKRKKEKCARIWGEHRQRRCARGRRGGVAGSKAKDSQRADGPYERVNRQVHEWRGVGPGGPFGLALEQRQHALRVVLA